MFIFGRRDTKKLIKRREKRSASHDYTIFNYIKSILYISITEITFIFLLSAEFVLLMMMICVFLEMVSAIR